MTDLDDGDDDGFFSVFISFLVLGWMGGFFSLVRNGFDTATGALIGFDSFFRFAKTSNK